MVKAYFISDLHIGAEDNPNEDERQKHILKFLQRISKEATHLFIVGDLFDFWFEYGTVIPKKHFDFLHMLKKMTDSGIEIQYLAGNHDFALGEFFDKSMNVKTWSDEYTFELAGKKFFLWHGDGLAKDDSGYRLLKRILRSRFNQRLFRWLHPDLGFRLASFTSGSSRKYTNQLNDQRDESDYTEFAEQKFSEGFDYVLMGHRHRPLVYDKGKHRYINLGDWIYKFSYAVFDGAELRLQDFPMDQKYKCVV